MRSFIRTRIALATFAGAALTALGCSLIVEFDEAQIPGETPDTGAETSTETGLPDTGMPDTTMPDTTMPDTTMPDTTMPDTADTAPGDTADTTPGDTADSTPADTADTATGDTADTAMDDTADATPADTADAATEDTTDATTPDTTDTAAEDTADTATEDTADTADTTMTDTADAAAEDTADASDATTVSFSADVQPIFNARCTSCHTSAHSTGLDLTAGASYAKLVNVNSACNGTTKLVVPGDTANSLLWQKVADHPSKCGGSMPAGGPALSTAAPAEFAKIEMWIQQGALNN